MPSLIFLKWRTSDKRIIAFSSAWLSVVGKKICLLLVNGKTRWWRQMRQHQKHCVCIQRNRWFWGDPEPNGPPTARKFSCHIFSCTYMYAFPEKRHTFGAQWTHPVTYHWNIRISWYLGISLIQHLVGLCTSSWVSAQFNPCTINICNKKCFRAEALLMSSWPPLRSWDEKKLPWFTRGFHIWQILLVKNWHSGVSLQDNAHFPTVMSNTKNF